MRYTSQHCCDKTMDDKMALHRECCFPNCTKSWWMKLLLWVWGWMIVPIAPSWISPGRNSTCGLTIRQSSGGKCSLWSYFEERKQWIRTRIGADRADVVSIRTNGFIVADTSSRWGALGLNASPWRSWPSSVWHARAGNWIPKVLIGNHPFISEFSFVKTLRS